MQYISITIEILFQGPQYGITNFDNIGQAMLTVFQEFIFQFKTLQFTVQFIQKKILNRNGHMRKYSASIHIFFQ